MRASRVLVPLAALSLPLVTLAAPAQANQSLSGTVTVTDPLTTIYQPNSAGDAQRCGDPATAAKVDAPADTISYVAKSTGLRTVTVRVTPDAVSQVAVYLYRNGTCVAGDYDEDNAAEGSAGIIDLVNVPISFGDNVKVVIATFTPPLSWTATITEPPSVAGKATHKTTGKAKKYVTFPKAVNCTNHHATAKLKKKAKNARFVVFKADNKKLKKVTRIKPGKKITLRHVPAKTTKLKAIVKLKSGKKLTASRSYYRCL